MELVLRLHSIYVSSNGNWEIKILTRSDQIFILDKEKRTKLVYAYGKGDIVKAISQKHRTPRSDLPTYSMEDVGKHASR